MWNEIIKFFTTVPLWELLLIFCFRIIEVSIGTLRIIMISKGYRKQGAILAFFEVLLWVFVASRVIIGISEAPLKGIIYCLGFAFGVYIGSLIESKLAVGKVVVEGIVSIENASAIADALREAGHGVTVIKGEGKATERRVVMVLAHRRNKQEIYQKILEIEPTAVIITNDVTTLQGGYLHSIRRFIK